MNILCEHLMYLQTMSELELRRRTITGLLTNGSVTMETLRTLTSGHEDMRNPVVSSPEVKLKV